MTTETYHLGPAPADESCVQVSDPDYFEKARRECLKYVTAIRFLFGDEPPGARLKVVWQEHDFGPYLEVAVAFDPTDRAAAEYAARCDAQAPTTWAAAGLDDPNADDAGRDIPNPSPSAGKRYVGRRNAGGGGERAGRAAGRRGVPASASARPAEPTRPTGSTGGTRAAGRRNSPSP